MPVIPIIRRVRRRLPKGAAAVEFAIILPLLMTIVLACVDFGRFAHTYIAVTNAARAGAGFASFHPYTASTRQLWDDRTREAVETELGAIEPDATEPDPEFDVNKLDVPSPVVSVDADGFERVRVEVSYPFATLAAWPLLPNDLILRRAVEMRFVR